MHGTGIAADHQAGATEQTKRLAEREAARKRNYLPRHKLICYPIGARSTFDAAGKNQWMFERFCQPPYQLSGALFRPSLGIPTAERVDKNEASSNNSRAIQKCVKASLITKAGVDFRIEISGEDTGCSTDIRANLYRVAIKIRLPR